MSHLRNMSKQIQDQWGTHSNRRSCLAWAESTIHPHRREGPFKQRTHKHWESTCTLTTMLLKSLRKVTIPARKAFNEKLQRANLTLQPLNGNLRTTAPNPQAHPSWGPLPLAVQCWHWTVQMFLARAAFQACLLWRGEQLLRIQHLQHKEMKC